MSSSYSTENHTTTLLYASHYSSQNEAHIPYSNFLVGSRAIAYTDALTLYSLLPCRRSY